MTTHSHIRAFLRGTRDACMELWRSMPEDWTIFTEIAQGRPLSSTSEQLRDLHRIGAVERMEHGRQVFYRPRLFVRLPATIIRREGRL